MTHLPSDEDIIFYQEHGYWVSPPILPAGLLDEAGRGMRRHHAGDVDHEIPDTWGWRPEHGDVLRKNDYASRRVSELDRLVRHPAIAACAARLSGSSEIRLWHDQLLYKPPGPGGTNVGWHADRQYWLSCSSEDMLTAWVPFHDITGQAGPLMFVPGSHRWRETRELSFFDQDLSTIETLLRAHGARPVAITLARGQFSFHHCRTIHGSGPNLSGEPRRSLAIHLQPGGNHYLAGATHANDTLVATCPDGTPDYADPTLCPVLWPVT
jgi:ectoine hydroxylase-related dioxygenase (phytanoyl-CoA dioxygenase family)